MDENEEEKRISRIGEIVEQRKDLTYDFDRARKRREITDFLSEHKKEFINWLKEEGYDVEKIQKIMGDYREHYPLHESFCKYYLERQKTKYKIIIEESLGDTEIYNIVLNRALHKKNKFEYLRIFTSSLQPEELEQIGITETEKELTVNLFHSLYTFFQDLLIEHRLNCQKIPDEWRPEIFQIKTDNKDEGKTEIERIPEWIKKLIDDCIIDIDGKTVITNNFDKVAIAIGEQGISVTKEILKRFIKKDGYPYSSSSLTQALCAVNIGNPSKKTTKKL